MVNKGDFLTVLQVEPAKISKRIHRTSKLTSLKGIRKNQSYTVEVSAAAVRIERQTNLSNLSRLHLCKQQRL